MSWIENYQLFLFDFDGLLVNTEQLHLKAYQNMVAVQGFHLPWTFADFCLHAHYSSTALREGLYKTVPQLQECGLKWEELYKEKKKQYLKLLEEGAVELMPGAPEMLMQLHNYPAKMCVVTHSPKEHIEYIRAQIPILQTIPHWITRDDYQEPKPSAQCYELAIAKYALPQEKVIGFEDSPRGLKALQQTRAQAVLIAQFPYPDLAEILLPQSMHYGSLQEFMSHRP